MILACSGKLGSGKNELCKIITTEYPQYLFQTKAFADKLKRIVSDITGMPIRFLYSQEGKNIFIDEYNMTLGQMLQSVGTKMKEIDSNIWVKSLMCDYSINTFRNDDYSNWLISDLRFKNELQSCIDNKSFLVRIEGDPKKTRENSKRDLNHVSEIDLDDFTGWDYIVNNNGSLDDLRNHAHEIMKLFTIKNNIKY
jgi:cytidylate kinase